MVPGPSTAVVLTTVGLIFRRSTEAVKRRLFVPGYDEENDKANAIGISFNVTHCSRCQHTALLIVPQLLEVPPSAAF